MTAARKTRRWARACAATRMVAPAGCATQVIDRHVRRGSGAMALRRRGDGFEVTPARPPGYDRPWARAATQASDAPEPRRTPSASAPARDATPRDEDLET